MTPNDPRKDLSPKAAGAAQGGGVGAMLTVVIMWALEESGVEMDPTVVAALVGLLTAAAGSIGAYVRRDWLRDVGAEKVMAVEAAEARELGTARAAYPAGASRALPPEGAVTGPPDKEA